MVLEQPKIEPTQERQEAKEMFDMEKAIKQEAEELDGVFSKFDKVSHKVKTGLATGLICATFLAGAMVFPEKAEADSSRNRRDKYRYEERSSRETKKTVSNIIRDILKTVQVFKKESTKAKTVETKEASKVEQTKTKTTGKVLEKGLEQKEKKKVKMNAEGTEVEVSGSSSQAQVELEKENAVKDAKIKELEERLKVLEEAKK